MASQSAPNCKQKKKKNRKTQKSHALFYCFLFFFCLQLGADWEAISKTRASCFTGVFQTLENNKRIISSVFSCLETPVKHEARVFEILHDKLVISTLIEIYFFCFYINIQSNKLMSFPET